MPINHQQAGRYLIYTMDVFDVLKKHFLNEITDHKSNLEEGPKPGLFYHYYFILKKTLSRRSLWAYIARGTSKGCHGDAHTP